MAHHARTLTGIDETPRPFFGLSLVEMLGCVIVYIVGSKIVGHAAGLAALVPFIPAVGLAGVCMLTHKVRVEPYLAQLNNYVMRRLSTVTATDVPHRIIEVDGYSLDALDESDQDNQVIWRLQQQVASLGAGAMLQMLVVKDSRDRAEIAARIRAESRPTTPALRLLIDRRCARMEQPVSASAGGGAAAGAGGGAAAHGAVLRYYVVVYEPAAWRPPFLARLPLVGAALAPPAEDTSLDDVTATVYAALIHMGLRPTYVSEAARVGGAIVKGGEGPAHVALAGGLHASSFYMLMAPGETDPGFTGHLVNTEGPYHLSIWAHGTDPDREAARLGQQQNRNVVMALTGARVSSIQQEKVAEADRALLALRRPGQGIARLGLYYTAFGATPAEARRRASRAQLTLKRAMAARPARGLFHQGPLYVASHVGRDAARSVYSVHVETVANAYPFNRDNPSMDRGYRIGATDRGEEVLFDPSDESLANALVVCLGLSGRGKTHLTQRLMREHLEYAGRVTAMGAIFGQYTPLMALVGGVTVRTADELDAVPIETQFVFVDVAGSDHIDLSLMRAIDQRVQTRVGDVPHALVLEEAWQLTEKGASLWVNELARFGRSWGGFVLWISHDPEDLLKHPHITAMFKNAGTKICFALSDGKGVASTLGGQLDLSHMQVRTVKQLARGECFIIRTNVLRGTIVQGKALVGADPEEKWLYLTDPRLPQYQTRQRYIDKHDGDILAAIIDLADTVPYDDAGTRRVSLIEETATDRTVATESGPVAV